MVYRYVNEYTDEEIFFDAVLLKELSPDDIPEDELVRDMRETNIKSPYPYDVLVDKDELMIVTRPGRVSIWYNGFSYEFKYDEAVYFNGEMLCGVYEIIHNTIYLEYIIYEDDVLEIGLGLKYGGIRIFPKGRLTYNKEHFIGKDMTKLDFKLKH